MIFNQRHGDTTWPNQIASDVILNRPLQTIAANPQTILTNTAADVIKSVPSVCDETNVLPSSEIGGLAAYARRKGNTWFLAVVNGPQPRTLNVPLVFLGNDEHCATTVRDLKDSSAGVQVEQATARRADSLKIELEAGGGFVARLSRP